MCFHLHIIQLLEMIKSEICFKIMQFEGRIKMKHNCPSADNYWSWAIDTQRHFTLFFSIPYTLEKFHNKVFFNEDHSALVCFSYFFTFFANWEVGKQAAEPPWLCISLSQALYGFHYFSSSICYVFPRCLPEPLTCWHPPVLFPAFLWILWMFVLLYYSLTWDDASSATVNQNPCLHV